MSDTEIVVNNMANTNDDQHNTKPNAEEFTECENTNIDLNNCLCEALIKT